MIKKCTDNFEWIYTVFLIVKNVLFPHTLADVLAE